MGLGVRAGPGEQELVWRGQRVEHLELPVAREDRVVPLHVIQHRRGTGVRGPQYQAGGAQPWVERAGLADPELAEHGAP